MLIRSTLLLLFSATTAFALSEENVKEQFDVTAGGNLVVDVDFGSIDVTAGADNKVIVDAYRKIDADNEAREKEFLAAAPIKVTKEGNTVKVRATHERERGWSWGWKSHRVTNDARYTISVPKNFNLDLNTSGGSIAANGVKGTIKVDTSGGSLKFVDLHGPIKASTSGGNIESKGGSGQLDAETSGGEIEVTDFQGNAIVETSGGKLSLRNIQGKLVGETSGGSIFASLSNPMAGDVRLETSAGNIEVAVPDGVGVDLSAESGIGRLVSELAVETTRADSEELAGKINGGGKSLVLQTGAGNIAITQASAASPTGR